MVCLTAAGITLYSGLTTASTSPSQPEVQVHCLLVHTPWARSLHATYWHVSLLLTLGTVLVCECIRLNAALVARAQALLCECNVNAWYFVCLDETPQVMAVSLQAMPA